MRTNILFRVFTSIVVLSGIWLIGINSGVSQENPPYKNPELGIEERVNDLLPRMTTVEKAHQLASFFPNANVRLGIPHMQAAEALKVLCGMPEAGYGIFRTIDLLNMSFDSLTIEKNSACRICGNGS